MICMVIFANGIFAYADTSDLQEYRDMYTAEEQRRINMITQSENSEDWIGVVEENFPLEREIEMYPFCEDCYEISVTVCAGEAILVDEGYHKDLLGIVTTDCYAYYFNSRGADMCPVCGKVIFQYGQHACWEIHKKCSKGDYDVCPMKIS